MVRQTVRTTVNCRPSHTMSNSSFPVLMVPTLSSGSSRLSNSSISMAGVVESLDILVKEFVAANDEEKKVVFTRMEEEAEKLKGSASRAKTRGDNATFFCPPSHWVREDLLEGCQELYGERF